MSQTPNTTPARTFVEEHELVRYQMWAPDPNAEGERANLKFVFRGPNPSIVVWLRGPSEKGKPPVRAPFNSLSFDFFIDALRVIADSAPGSKPADIELKNARYLPDGGREDFVQAYVRVSKNSDGVVLIGVFDAQDDTRSRVLFPVTLDRWTGLVKRNGEALSQAETSSMVARNLAGVLEHENRKRMAWPSQEEQAAQRAQFESRTGKGGGRPNRPGPTNGKPNGFRDYDDTTI